MSDVVYLNKFWPRPLTPAMVAVELEIDEGKGTDAAWDYHAKVCFADGRTISNVGELKAESKQHAELSAMYKLVTLLGEELADEIRRSENMAAELNRLRK